MGNTGTVKLPAYLEGKSVRELYVFLKRTYLDTPFSDSSSEKEIKDRALTKDPNYHEGRFTVYKSEKKNGVEEYYWNQKFGLNDSYSYARPFLYQGKTYTAHLVYSRFMYKPDEYGIMIFDSSFKRVAEVGKDWTASGEADLVSAALSTICNPVETPMALPIEVDGISTEVHGFVTKCSPFYEVKK